MAEVINALPECLRGLEPELLVLLVQDENNIMAILNEDGTVNSFKVDLMRAKLLPLTNTNQVQQQQYNMQNMNYFPNGGNINNPQQFFGNINMNNNSTGNYQFNQSGGGGSMQREGGGRSSRFTSASSHGLDGLYNSNIQMNVHPQGQGQLGVNSFASTYNSSNKSIDLSFVPPHAQGEYMSFPAPSLKQQRPGANSAGGVKSIRQQSTMSDDVISGGGGSSRFSRYSRPDDSVTVGSGGIGGNNSSGGNFSRRPTPAFDRNAPKSATQCRFFSSFKGCQFGDKCAFGHFQDAPSIATTSRGLSESEKGGGRDRARGENSRSLTNRAASISKDTETEETQITDDFGRVRRGN
jgi:hypothetical protein